MNEPFEMCQVCGDRLVVEASGQSHCAACRDALMNQVTAQLLPESIFPGGHRPTTTNAASGGDGGTGMLMQPVIPGLRMIRFIDGGGMGVVWLAEQEATEREVAVKLIRASGWGRNAMARARFEREIELAARLDHPNIARVFHGGEADGEPYCVMEFIPGVPVTTFVKRDGWSRAQTLTVIRKICEAVDHAHRRGVLHRDLKPSNILVTADGEPKLLDFGLARALDGSDMTLTVEGVLAGTPAYMSPEQAKGETKLIDTRSDVYSLGVICYELLTGRPPYEVDGTMAGMIRVVSMAEVKRPRAVDRSISPELEMFLLHALAASPSDRYESAGQMGEDVRRYLQQEPLIAGRTSTKYFVRKWMARHKLAVAAALAVAAIMATALSYHWRTLRHEKETAQNAEAQARELLHRSLKVGISENLQRGAFTSALQMIDEAMQIGHPNRDELLFQRIEALEALNDPEAISLVESLDPKTLAPEQRPRLAYWKGERLLQNGKAEEGLALLNQSLAAGLPPVEERLARAALSATVREAVEHYQAAAALAPWRAVAQRNLALALVLSGRVGEARTQIGICHLLFPADENLYMLEVIMEGFQGNVEAASAAAAKIPKTPRGGGGALYASAARPLAGMARDMVRAMQGLAPKSSLAEQLALRMVVGKLLSHRGGTPDTSQSIPGLNSAPPVLARGINGFIKSLQKFQNGDKKGSAEEIRSAVSVCEDGSLWALLAAILVDSGKFSEVVEAAKKAQTLPCLMSGAHDAAKVLEASALAALYVESKDPVPLEQSAALFREIYKSNQNSGELMHSMPLAVAFKSGDFFLARLVAESMPRDSADQLTVLAKIEYGAANHPKALKIVEKAMKLFPEDTSLTSLHEKIVAKSLEGFPDQPRAE